MEKILKFGSVILCVAFMAALVSCGGGAKENVKLGDEEVKAGNFPDGCITNYPVFNSYSQAVKDELYGKWALLQTVPGKGHFELSGGVCKIVMEGAGTDNWQVQLIYIPADVKFGKPYQMSFDCKADAERKLYFKVGKEGGDWLAYSGMKNFDITTDWKTYSFVFKSIGKDDAARVEFECGLSKANLYFRNVSLRPVLE